MRILAGAIFILASLIYSLFFTVPTASAEGEFETDYDVTYNVNEEGTTTVTQQITLKNKTPNFYADKFELKIGSTKVENVSASDNTGVLKTEVKFENSLTTIAVQFNQKVIGTGKSLSWNLTYTSNELTAKSGQIWEISIPKLAKSSDIGSYQAKVTVPEKFGPQAFAIPNPKEEESNLTSQMYTFDKDQLLESGIAMSFGEKQVFSFKLNYYLENNNVTSQTFPITLPPDNNYQQIVLEKLNPLPQNVTIDEDGNFTALFKLKPREKVDIIAEGFVEVFHKPFRNIYSPLTQNERDLYTQPQRYWETDSAIIHDKANELKEPKKIYDFVVNFLSYNQNRLSIPEIERKGAASAYASPADSVCTDFTDLFIAIARSAKIPAREVTGFAFTQNERLRPLSLALDEGDILHAWPEYWDENLGWIQIDPTWDSTSGGLDFFNKLDFNHITFTQRGKSSTTPLPPGAFKREGQENQKSVFVEFAKELPNSSLNPKLSIIAPPKIISGIPTKVKAEVKNQGSVSIYNQNLILQTSILKNTGELSFPIKILPPFSKNEYDFRLTSGNLLLNSQDTLVLSYMDSRITQLVSIEPFYNLIFSPIFITSIIVILIFLTIGFFFYKRFFKKIKPPTTLP